MARTRSGPTRALADLAGALVPLSVRELQREIADRVRKIPTPLNDYGFDPYGLHPKTAVKQMIPSTLLYRYYFRVRTRGIERVPRGRVMLVANHAGQLPFDGAMLGVALLLEAEPPRLMRAMGEYWIPRLPFMSVWAARSGALVGTPANCRALLEADDCVAVFPEGVRGLNKVHADRYELQRFGTGFMRLALDTGSPIVPVGIVGSEEQQPAFANWERLGRLLGMPAFPVTPTFPWLGPLGLWPLPVRYHLHFGAPLRFEGSGSDEDAVIDEHVATVREAIEQLLREGLEQREGIFR
jgi:1-acyl-sn-glycerol-3-phosphate acyltransferase